MRVRQLSINRAVIVGIPELSKKNQALVVHVETGKSAQGDLPVSFQDLPLVLGR